MKQSIKTELKAYIIEGLEELDVNSLMRKGHDTNELHQQLFNEDYYIIGYYNCEQWLKKHNLSTFEAIEIVQEYERTNFGETNTELNSESIVNMLAYIYGEELLYHCMDEIREPLPF